MKRIFSTLLFGVMLLVGASAFAVPAYSGLVKLTQPNGEEISVYLFGDERVNWIESQDGYTLMYNKQGYLEYAMQNDKKDLVPSGVMARNANLRSATDNIFLSSIKKDMRLSEAQLNMRLAITKAMDHTKSSTDGKTTGIRKVLVILIQYSDKAFKNNHVDSLFNDEFNNMNYASGSLRKYFSDNSYGKLDMQCVIAGPITLAHTRSYYGANGTYGHDQNAQQMIIDACKGVDSIVDFSQYDNDGDGKVDGVHVIYARGGEADGGPAESIWPHESYIYSTTLMLDGVRIYKYSCASELSGGDYYGSLTGIGVHVHEMGHVLGLPDYYDTDYSTNGVSKTLSSLDVMDAGSYNNNGKTPPLYNAYSRIFLGWASPYVLDSNMIMDITTIPTTDTALVFRINTPTEGEYFLLENKDFLGWNAYMDEGINSMRDYSNVKSGLLMLHIDASENAYGWTDNCLNCNSSRNSIELRSADGQFNGSASTSFNYSTMANLLYPGSSNVTSLTDSTTNNLRSWANAPSSVKLTNINYTSSTNNHITFKLNGGSEYGVRVTTLPATLTDSTTAVLKAKIQSSTLGTATTETGFVISETPYPRVSDGNLVATIADTISYTVDTLRKGIVYYYRAYGKNSNGIVYGNQYSFLTLSAAITNNVIYDSIYAACETGETPTIVAELPEGGSGDYNYRWQESQDSLTWKVALSISSKQYYTPSVLTTPTYYRRIVTSADKADTSAIIRVGIVPITVAGTISGQNDTIVAGSSIGNIVLTGNTGDVQTWQRKKNSSSWTSLGSTSHLTTFTETLSENGSYQYRAMVKSGACPSKVTNSVVVVVGASSLNDIESTDNSYGVYPNPSTGVFNFAFNTKDNSSVDLRIVNVLGETLYIRNSVNGNVAIDASTFGKGTYVLLITKSGNIVGKKILIVK